MLQLDLVIDIKKKKHNKAEHKLTTKANHTNKIQTN